MKKGTVLVLWVILFLVAVVAIVFFQDYDKPIPVGKVTNTDGGEARGLQVVLNIGILVVVLTLFWGFSYVLGRDRGEKDMKGVAMTRIPPGRYKKILIQEECAFEHKYWYFFRLMDKDTEKRICCFIPKNEIVNEQEAIISKSEIPNHFEVIIRRHQDEKADSKKLSEEMYIIKPIIEEG